MKKLYLEFIRGAAAVTVLLYHFLELHTLGSHSKHFYLSNWGTDAVIVFFILSGIVINISQTHNPKPKGEFIANRLLRIYPLLIVGLLMGLFVLFATKAPMPSAGTITGNFFMVSALAGYMNNIVPCIETNSPLWSLSFEIVFYLLFAFSIGKHQKRILFSWFLISLAAMPFYYFGVGNDVFKHLIAVLSFSSIWLIGYYIYEYRHSFYADKYVAIFSAGALPLISRMHLSHIYYDPAKYLLFAIFAMPFFRYCLQVPAEGKKIRLYYLALPYVLLVYIVFTQPYITFLNFVLYSSLPIGLLVVCFMASILNLKDLIISKINTTGSVLGKYSYALYITHYPVLFFCASYFHSTIVYLVIGLSFVILITYSLETYLQPAVVVLFKKLKKTYLIPEGKFTTNLVPLERV